MNNLVTSVLTGKSYNPKDVVRIINIQQVGAYLEYGVPLLDLYTSRNKENKIILVGIFDRKDSYDAYDKWCKHELN